jgi:branched-chain amino acid transport system substrate-binding protein
MTVAYEGKIAATAPSFTPQCLAAKAAHATASFVVDGPAIVPRVIDSCAQQGYKPAQYNTGGDVDATVAKDPNANGLVEDEFNLSFTDTSTPAGQLVHQIQHQYAPSVALNDSLMSVFAGLQLFREVGNASKLTPSSTPKDVVAGLYALPKGETLGGLAPPLTYVTGKPTVIPCWFSSKLSGGSYKVLSAQPQCVPAAQQAKLYAAFR